MKITDCVDIHPDIMKAEIENPHGNGNVIAVTSPGLGIYGDKVKDTVTLIYECQCNAKDNYNQTGSAHQHQALYGPAVKFAENCKFCEMIKMWCKQGDHIYTPLGEDVYDYSKMVLYAD